MILIRAAEAGDAAQITAIYTPHVAASAVSFETEVPTTRAMRARMESSKGLYPWIVAPSADLAAYALVVDAKDEVAAAFYRYHGFIALPAAPLTLFLPLATLQSLR